MVVVGPLQYQTKRDRAITSPFDFCYIIFDGDDESGFGLSNVITTTKLVRGYWLADVPSLLMEMISQPLKFHTWWQQQNRYAIFFDCEIGRCAGTWEIKYSSSLQNYCKERYRCQLSGWNSTQIPTRPAKAERSSNNSLCSVVQLQERKYEKVSSRVPGSVTGVGCVLRC